MLMWWQQWMDEEADLSTRTDRGFGRRFFHVLMNKEEDRVLVALPLLQMMNIVMAKMLVIAERVIH